MGIMSSSLGVHPLIKSYLNEIGIIIGSAQTTRRKGRRLYFAAGDGEERYSGGNPESLKECMTLSAECS